MPVLRYLNQHHVAAFGGLDPHLALQNVIDAVYLLREGSAAMPAETQVDLATPRGKVCSLPARLGGRFNASGVKWTAHRPDLNDGQPQAMAMTLFNRAGATKCCDPSSVYCWQALASRPERIWTCCVPTFPVSNEFGAGTERLPD